MPENERIARRVPEDIATEGRLELIDEVYAPDAVERGPFGEEIRGATAIRTELETYRTAFPDLSATVEDVVTQDNTVAMRVTLRGTHEGEYRGVEPTHKQFEIQNMVFTRLENGAIAERWLQPDTLGLLQQLGIRPADLSTGMPTAEP